MPASLQLKRCSPESQGISSEAIADFVSTVESDIKHLHSFMLLRHGQVISEGWWHPWRPDVPHMLFSLSKSFTSTAVGLAIAEGRLSVDDPLLSFFPQEAPKKISNNLARMKVHHLLSMSTGHDQDTTERVFKRGDPIKRFLSLPVEHTPGTHFVYNTAASYVLSAILQKLTGQTLVEYLTPRLFKPMGIEGATWESHPNGINFGGWGLSIKTEDIAHFGQLYLQRGEWNGERILPEDWVEAASRAHVSNGDDPNSDWCQGYGYQFWRCRYDIYRGDGAFGQFCIVMPQQEAVLAITGGVADMQPVLNIIWEKLLPAMENESLPANETGATALAQRLKNLEISPPNGAISSPMAKEISGKTYSFEPNQETLHSLRFDFGKDEGTLTYRLLGGGRRRGIHQLAFKYGTLREGVGYLAVPQPMPMVVSSSWMSEDVFTLTMFLYETPFIITFTCRFEGKKITCLTKFNVAFGPLESPPLIGTAA